MSNCLFCQIASGDKPSRKIYEDDELFAFHDINPQAPIHILIIPKKHYETIEDTPADILGKLMVKAAELAKEAGISAKGYRTVINCREHGGQSVYHLHLHLLGGRWLHWPPG